MMKCGTNVRWSGFLSLAFFLTWSTVVGVSSSSLEERAATILAKNCYSCHNEVKKEGGLSMHTHAALMEGGDNGAALLPQNAEESRMLLMVEGLLEPIMPEDDFLSDEDIGSLWDWVSAGAAAWKGDLGRIQLENLAPIALRAPTRSEIASLAFHPSGDLLAGGAYGEVQLFASGSQEIIARLTGHPELVRAVAFSSDGSILATAGGMPARYGEIQIWETRGRMLLRRWEGHSDCIYSLALDPEGKLLATSSYDRLVKVWEVETGKELRTLKGHADAVYAIAFDLGGNRLFSASADRTVKIWDVETGTQLGRPLGEGSAELYSLALHPSGKLLAAAGEDKMIRIWKLYPQQGGELTSSFFAHDSSVLRLAFTPDGQTLISAGSDRFIKFWDVETSQEKRTLEPQPDWVLALAVSPDSKRLALGRYDGPVVFHEVQCHD